MGLGTSKSHVLGRNQIFFAKAETTKGTFIKPTATDALMAEQSMFKSERQSDPLLDTSSYRYVTDTVQERSTYTWSLDTDLRPSATAATETDIGPLLTAALGANNSGASSKWIYTMSSAQDWPTLSLTRHFASLWQECMWGAFVDSMKISISGTSRPKIHFDGRAMGHQITGVSTLNGAMSGTTMIVQTVDQYLFGTNSVVQIDANNNTGAGWQVTADASRPSFTVEGSVTEGSGDPVVPYVPTPSYLGTPASGISGLFQLASTTIPITDAEITLENNHDFFEDEAFAQAGSDFAPDRPKITVSLGFRMRQDFLPHLGNPQAWATQDLFFRCGPDTAGYRFKFDIDYGEAMLPEISIPTDKAGTAKLTFQGLGSGANGPLIITTD